MSGGQDLAIVGIGYSELSRRDAGYSVGGLALRAARAAILDAGLEKSQIDGVGAIYAPDLATVWPGYVVEGLGLQNVVWASNCMPASANIVVEGLNAVRAGLCNYALVYHAKFRWDVTSSSARKDPLRRSPPTRLDGSLVMPLVETYAALNPFAAYMRRHMHDYGSRREHYGMVAVNNRTRAQKNPRAVFYGQPMSMDDYLAAPVITDPFTMLDMDTPIDGAMALVVTTMDRAKDLAKQPVRVVGHTNGTTGKTDMVFQPFDFFDAAKVVADNLWRQSGFTADDIDVANVYDGFTVLTLDWLEAAFCKRGESPGLLEDAWDPASQTLKLFGRIPLSTHGGNLSEGRVQGMGHVLESVLQLRGEAEERQVPGARRALVLNGANPVNAGLMLAVD